MNDVSERLVEINVKTLLIHGGLDYDDYKKATDQTKVKNSQKLCHKNRNHMVHLCEPKLFNKTVADFIKSNQKLSLINYNNIRLKEGKARAGLAFLRYRRSDKKKC